MYCVIILLNDGTDFFFLFLGNSLSQVQAPPSVQAQDPKTKPECYGVFCLTYDLKAVSSESLQEVGFVLPNSFNGFVDLFFWTSCGVFFWAAMLVHLNCLSIF